MSTVLVVDGPMQGKVLYVDGHRFNVSKPPSMMQYPYHPDHEVTLDYISYHVHKIAFLGVIIRIASVHAIDHEISKYDMIDLLLSGDAKQACEV